MPARWPECSEWRGPAAKQAAVAELRYVSRRRADPELGEKLLREALPKPTLPPSLEARPASVDSSWPEAAPAPPVAIEQLFEPGVYAELQGSIQEVVAAMAAAEERMRRGEEPGVIPGRMPEVYSARECQPAWARSRVWDVELCACRPVLA